MRRGVEFIFMTRRFKLDKCKLCIVYIIKGYYCRSYRVLWLNIGARRALEDVRQMRGNYEYTIQEIVCLCWRVGAGVYIVFQVRENAHKQIFIFICRTSTNDSSRRHEESSYRVLNGYRFIARLHQSFGLLLSRKYTWREKIF